MGDGCRGRHSVWGWTAAASAEPQKTAQTTSNTTWRPRVPDLATFSNCFIVCLGPYRYCSTTSVRAQAAGAVNTLVFDSGEARGDNTDVSDLDLIVRFEPGRSLLDHGGLVMDLRELLNTRVDVIDEEAMRPRFRQATLAEAVPL